MRSQPILRKAIPVDCRISKELQAMLPDFKEMVNRLISWGLFVRVRDPREMRDRNYVWFQEKYGGRYASHYLHSACSVACELLSSWDKLGGNTSSRPYVRKPFARLDRMLVKVERRDRAGIHIRVTLAPHHFAYVEAKVHHRFWNEYLGYRVGELTVVPDGIRLLVQVPDERPVTDKTAAVDLNFQNAVAATSDGRIVEVDLKPIMVIQERMRKKRKRVRRALPTNLQKQRKVLNRAEKRERHRVEDLLYEAARDFVALVENGAIGFEDLRTLSAEDAKGRRYKERLSS
jgi:transposase